MPKIVRTPARVIVPKPPPSLLASCGRGLLALIFAPVAIVVWPLVFIGVLIWCTVELFRATWTLVRKGNWITAIVVLPFGLSTYFALGVGTVAIEAKWLATIYRYAAPLLKRLS